MLYRVMDKRELPKLVRAFMESYEVVAPVKRGNGFIFDRIESPDEIELEYSQTASSPKKYFMPPVETMMRFDAQMNLVGDYVEKVVPRVVFGVHTCDINALNRLDVALLGGKYVDPYYKARRDATMVIRPEAVKLADTGQIGGEVSLSTFMGAYQYYRLLVGGQEVQITDYNPVNRKIYEVGEKAFLDFDPSGVYIL